MIDPSVIKKIEDFVYEKPRSIQEIAMLIEKNWRTADRYVDEISKNFGTINSRIFREGTRGALKIVYWSAIDKVSYSVFQKQLEEDIFKGRTKYDFSGFDIFQHVPDGKKHAWVKEGKNEVEAGRLSEFKELLLKAEKQILFFSGNLSFINFKDRENDIFDILEKLVKKGINIKIISRIDFGGIDNVKKLLSLNHKYGKEFIQIRHREQPLRTSVIDNKMFNIKEIKEPTGRPDEIKNKTFIFYNITDRDWVEWLMRIFWKMFNTSIDSKKRMDELKRIEM